MVKAIRSSAYNWTDDLDYMNQSAESGLSEPLLSVQPDYTNARSSGIKLPRIPATADPVRADQV